MMENRDTENQLHELREFCRRTGSTVVHEYVDRASGKTSERPQFKRMFEDASKRKLRPRPVLEPGPFQPGRNIRNTAIICSG